MLFEPIIYGLIFIGVLAMVEGFYLLLFGKTLKREKKVNRRLSLLQEGRDTEEVLTILRAEREGSERRRKLPVIGGLLDLARQASIAATPMGMALTLVGLMTLSFLLLTVFTGAVLQIRILVAVTLGYASLYLWLRDKAKKRIKLFEEQLPDALDLMVRSLRVGHPMTASIGIVAREMPDPLGTEFGLVADEATYGMNVNQALERVADRIPVADLRFLAVAMNIQSTSGGNLAEVLEGLSKVIRSRFKLFRKIKAITAEARWSGWFLSAFPIAALIVVQVVKPGYYDGVVDHALFVPATIAVGVMLAINIVFMRMMVNIKV